MKAMFKKIFSRSVTISRGKNKTEKQHDDYRLSFDEVYQKNLFAGDESLSGRGSNLDQTIVLRRDLISLLQKFNVKTFLDLPCGDFNWMRYVDFGGIDYIGGDVVKSLVVKNQKQFGDAKHRFAHLDLISSMLPPADAIFCRDCLVHLNYQQIFQALHNIKKSGIKYLMTTTFITHDNDDLSYIWRPLNLQKPPFCFPKPLELLNEECPEWNGEWTDKCMGVWEIDSLFIPHKE
jgi:hypothetical protein